MSEEELAKRFLKSKFATSFSNIPLWLFESRITLEEDLMKLSVIIILRTMGLEMEIFEIN